MDKKHDKAVQRGTVTDLQRLKDLAHCLLQTEPQKTAYSPVIVRHPFTDSGIIALKSDKGELRTGNIMEGEDDIREWRKMMGQVIDSAETVFGIYIHITKPYLLAFVKFAEPLLSKEDFAKILADAWIRSENPNNDPNLSRGRLLAMFRAADPKLIMDGQEQEMFNSLGDIVTIYRGVRSARPGSVDALSWTLDKEIAQWFACRFGCSGTVYEAKIEKKHIHALFLGRNESEVIINPRYLMDITQVQNLEQGMEQKM